MDLRNPSRAIRDYKWAIALGHRDANLFFNLAEAYDQLDKVDEAVAAFDQAVQMNLGKAGTRLQETREKQKRYQEALQSYLVGIDSQKSRRAEKRAQAGEALSHAIKRHPENPLYHRARGDLFLKQGHSDQAKNDYIQAIEVGDASEDVYRGLANAYEKLGRTAEASAAQARAQEIASRAGQSQEGGQNQPSELGNSDFISPLDATNEAAVTHQRGSSIDSVKTITQGNLNQTSADLFAQDTPTLTPKLAYSRTPKATDYSASVQHDLGSTTSPQDNPETIYSANERLPQLSSDLTTPPVKPDDEAASRQLAATMLEGDPETKGTLLSSYTHSQHINIPDASKHYPYASDPHKHQDADSEGEDADRNMSAKDYIRRGKERFRQGRYEKALADYNAALERDPMSAEAHYEKGGVLIQLQDNQAAQEAYADANRYADSNNIIFKEQIRQALERLGQTSSTSMPRSASTPSYDNPNQSNLLLGIEEVPNLVYVEDHFTNSSSKMKSQQQVAVQTDLTHQTQVSPKHTTAKSSTETQSAPPVQSDHDRPIRPQKSSSTTRSKSRSSSQERVSLKNDSPKGSQGRKTPPTSSSRQPSPERIAKDQTNQEAVAEHTKTRKATDQQKKQTETTHQSSSSQDSTPLPQEPSQPISSPQSHSQEQPLSPTDPITPTSPQSPRDSSTRDERTQTPPKPRFSIFGSSGRKKSDSTATSSLTSIRNFFRSEPSETSQDQSPAIQQEARPEEPSNTQSQESSSKWPFSWRKKKEQK